MMWCVYDVVCIHTSESYVFDSRQGFRGCLYGRRDGTFFKQGLSTVYMVGVTGCFPGRDVFHSGFIFLRQSSDAELFLSRTQSLINIEFGS